MIKIRQQIKKIILTKNNPPCGRTICYCLSTLNLTDRDDYEIYNNCYKTWLYFNKMNE